MAGRRRRPVLGGRCSPTTCWPGWSSICRSECSRSRATVRSSSGTPAPNASPAGTVPASSATVSADCRSTPRPPGASATSCSPDAPSAAASPPMCRPTPRCTSAPSRCPTPRARCWSGCCRRSTTPARATRRSPCSTLCGRPLRWAWPSSTPNCATAGSTGRSSTPTAAPSRNASAGRWRRSTDRSAPRSPPGCARCSPTAGPGSTFPCAAGSGTAGARCRSGGSTPIPSARRTGRSSASVS